MICNFSNIIPLSEVTMGSNLAYLITHVAALPFVRPVLCAVLLCSPALGVEKAAPVTKVNG